MIIPLLVLILGLQSQQELESRLQQKQQEVDQLNGKVGELSRTVERQDQELRRPFCSAELRFVGSSPSGSVSREVVLPLNLYSAVSKPANTCLPAEIRVAASYLDAFDNLICSGVIENAATQSNFTQNVNLLIRPWDLQEFVRWRNEPPQTNSGFKRLSCVDPDGLAEANNEALLRVRSVRVRITVLPLGGGISTVETNVSLQR
jgi:hypothetical protein